jgi:hypothetical protein
LAGEDTEDPEGAEHRTSDVVTRVAMTLVLLVLVVLLMVAPSCRKPVPVKQPMAMSHKRHMEANMKCLTCHPGAEDQTLAQFPTVTDCMDCHHKARGEHPEEPLVRQYDERKQEIPWIRVDNLPGHVYFPHGVHVTGAKMKCEECHVGILEATKPLALPDVNLTMGDCMRCHRDRNASNQCKVCHK